ncbi:OmpA family protein [Vibrio hippocampi]|uniref:Peptidoglycan-associated lipoprotein n=1 Tax=Vibrio hippocampi TaxID=654686 RepID=A0ABN8DMS4_9VIBR|nr:OmpA family protein [Vibrio hippocampi]CAH0529573.1 Peptidoglycan-associated lipoprotein [Vibrio hippocampi]
MFGANKVAWVLFASLLAGCSSTSFKDVKLIPDTLDIAPKSEHDVRHPDWAYGPIETMTTLKGNNGQSRPHVWGSLEDYLVQNGLDYEMVPGDYMMIRLKRKIHFNTGSTAVSSDSFFWLERLANFLSEQHGIDVVIGGHTDNTGTVSFNDNLSDQRAQQVKQALINQQVPRQLIYTRGYGEHVPACSNGDTYGQACNRRVELTLLVANNK